MPDRYLTFDLQISRGGEEAYLARIQSPHGDPIGTFRLTEIDSRVARLRQASGRGNHGRHVGLEDAASADLSLPTLAQEFGHHLFQTVFTGEVLGVLRTSQAEARKQEARLRLRLNLTEVPELAALPWEYLYDQTFDTFLALSQDTPIVRYLSRPAVVEPLAVELPLRILTVISSPRDYPALDVEREWENLREALHELEAQGTVDLRRAAPATFEELDDALRREEFHILHFIGHGDVDPDKGGLLLLEYPDKSGRMVPAQQIGTLLQNHRPLRLVILNACHGAAASGQDPFTGTAQGLLRKGIPAVIAMQFEITDRAAILFARRFYGALADRYPVEAALTAARVAMSWEDGFEWGTPVLFLRATDGVLFAGSESGGIAPPPEPDRPPQTDDFVGREGELAYFANKLSASHLAVITGMAGAGKTALAAVLAQRVSDVDKIFWHSFHPGEGIDAVIWKLAGFLAYHGQDELWRMLESARQSGGRLPPYETLFDYLLQLVPGHDYLLCFDDFQHVEDDPLLNRLVAHLRTVLRAGALSVIITSRRMPTFVTLDDFDPLEGLDLADTRQLLVKRGLALEDELIAKLHANTDGNPQFLMLAIAVLKRTTTPARLIDRLIETQDIARYLLREVDEQLSDEERAVMQAVAVLLGYPATRDAVEAVLDQGSAWRTLHELSASHLLVVTVREAVPEYVQHAMVQDFYYELLSRQERSEMHLRAGAYYESQEPDFLKAARHYERAGAHAEAVDVGTRHVWALINQGQARALLHLLEHIKGETWGAEQRARLRIAQGQLANLLGEKQAARTHYDEALSQLDAASGPPTGLLRAHAYKGLGEMLLYEAPQEALEWLQQGLDALPEGDTAEEADLYSYIGFAYYQLGKFQEALDALEACMERLPEGPSSVRGRALTNLQVIYDVQGDLERAKETGLQALAISQQLNDHFQTTDILTNLGVTRHVMGDWQGALRDFEKALALAERLGNKGAQAYLEGNLGGGFLLNGEEERALDHLNRALALSRESQLHLGEVLFLTNLADLQLRRKEVGAAEALLQQAEQLALKTDAENYLPFVYRVWAEISLVKSEAKVAREYAERSLALARTQGMELEQGMSQRTLGQALLDSGKQREALSAFECSHAILEGQDPYEAARTKVQWGLALVSSQPTRGRTLLQEAYETFVRLGATRDRRIVEQAISSR